MTAPQGAKFTDFIRSARGPSRVPLLNRPVPDGLLRLGRQALERVLAQESQAAVQVLWRLLAADRNVTGPVVDGAKRRR